MSKKLVTRPNLDHLRQQAKALLADLRNSHASAIATFREQLPSASSSSDSEILNTNWRLADAQFAIARQTGFASWPKLAVHEHMSGGLKRKLQLGILSWEGDTLVVNMAAPGKPRPTDFQSKVGSMQTISHWRVKG